MRPATCILPRESCSAVTPSRDPPASRFGLAQGIVGQPANLFPRHRPHDRSVLDQEESAAGRNLIDRGLPARSGGAGQNRVREQATHRFIDVFTKQVKNPRYPRLARLEEIAHRGRLRPGPRYIDSTEPEERPGSPDLW